MFYKFRKNKKAFTLVELIVVIAIIAILGTVVGVSVTRFVGQANERAALTAANTLATAWNSFITDDEYASKKFSVYITDNVENLSSVSVSYDGDLGNKTGSQGLTASGKIKCTKSGKTATVTISSGRVTSTTKG